jgi:Putative transposase
MTLAADEFIRRFLIHTLPPGFQRIRHFGFLANRFRKEKLALCRQLLATPANELLPNAAQFLLLLAARTGPPPGCLPQVPNGRPGPRFYPAGLFMAGQVHDAQAHGWLLPTLCSCGIRQRGCVCRRHSIQNCNHLSAPIAIPPGHRLATTFRYPPLSRESNYRSSGVPPQPAHSIPIAARPVAA